MKTIVLAALIALTTAISAHADDAVTPSKMERTRALVNEAQVPATKEPSTGDLSSTAWKMLQGLGITLGILCVGLGVAKKFGVAPPAPAKKRIKLLDRVAVSRKSSIILAEVDGRQVLLAVGGDPVTFHGDFTSESMFGASLEAQKKEVA